MNRAKRVAMVDRCRTDLSVRRQCALLGLARSGFYRQPAAADPEELALTRWLDERVSGEAVLRLSANDFAKPAVKSSASGCNG